MHDAAICRWWTLKTLWKFQVNFESSKIELLQKCWKLNTIVKSSMLVNADVETQCCSMFHSELSISVVNLADSFNNISPQTSSLILIKVTTVNDLFANSQFACQLRCFLMYTNDSELWSESWWWHWSIIVVALSQKGAKLFVEFPELWNFNRQSSRVSLSSATFIVFFSL